jgi:hypothetical protein
MVDVGGRDVDGLEKCSHKTKTVFGCLKKLHILGNLSYGIGQVRQ